MKNEEAYFIARVFGARDKCICLTPARCLAPPLPKNLYSPKSAKSLLNYSQLLTMTIQKQKLNLCIVHGEGAIQARHFHNIECDFDTYKNALMKNLVILFAFFCAFEPIDYFF